MNKIIVIFTFLACFTIGLARSSEKKHIALVCGTPHYSPGTSMPKMKAELEAFGLEVTLIQGRGDVEKRTEDVLPGIEAINEADLVIFFTRWLSFDDAEWEQIETFLSSGKPVIGLRTTNHGIKYPVDHPRISWNDGFGRRVFGSPYVYHLRGETKVDIYKGERKHPILSHLDDAKWVSPGTLYLSRLERGVTPLLLGTGKAPVRIAKKDFGVEVSGEVDTDVVAWTWVNEWGAKVFYTSLGHPGDFANPNFNRLWLNAVHHLLELPMPGTGYQPPGWQLSKPKE